MAKQKLIVILGPTASGKSGLALRIAKAFNGYLICADSRQVYKEMDIITGKDEGTWQEINNRKVYVVDGVEEYLVDTIEPKEYFSLADYQERFYKVIEDKKDSGQMPIMVGGTGLYISSIVDSYELPEGKPDLEMRAELENRLQEDGVESLYLELLKYDFDTAQVVDRDNPRKVIRALEYFYTTGKSMVDHMKKSESTFDILQIGITMPREILYDRINHRIDLMLEHGGWDETKMILDKYSEHLNSVTGIGYRQLGLALSGEMSKEQAVELFKRDTRRYAKRQLTWFNRDTRINWVGLGEEGFGQAAVLVKKFLE